jgi:hypothetical protein
MGFFDEGVLAAFSPTFFNSEYRNKAARKHGSQPKLENETTTKKTTKQSLEPSFTWKDYRRETGSSIMNLVPFPTSLSNVTVPPIPSVNLLTAAKPKP